jgi:hypothetical protein
MSHQVIFQFSLNNTILVFTSVIAFTSLLGLYKESKSHKLQLDQNGQFLFLTQVAFMHLARIISGVRN